MRRVLLVCVVLAHTAAVWATPVAAAESPAQRRVSAWLPYWDHTRGVAALQAHGDQFRDVSPFWFALSPAGVIEPYPNANATVVRDAIQAAGAAIIPTISNEFDRARVAAIIGDPLRRAAHVRALTDLTTTNRYDGLDVDYESLLASDRAAFSAFITELGASLHAAGKTLTVAVHPKTSEPGSWDGPQAQDYAAIGAAADRVRVMAYDYHWATSTAGAIAPASWVDQVAAFAASRIPAAKVELALPLYGYNWVGSNGVGVTYAEVRALIDRYRPRIRWSTTDQEYWFTYRDAARVTHTVWYSERRSTEVRLASVSKHGLGGVAFWRLGGEDATVWDATRSKLTAQTTARAQQSAPAVRITAPGDGSSVPSGGALVRYAVRASGPVVRAELYVDGVLRYADETGRGTFMVTRPALTPGRHRLTVRVLDGAGGAGVATRYLTR